MRFLDLTSEAQDFLVHIVGGGPSGLFAAHIVLERGVKVCVVHKILLWWQQHNTKATSGMNGALTNSQQKLQIKNSPEMFEGDSM